MEPSSSGIVYLNCHLSANQSDNPKEKILQSGLLDHCIFCLRKTGQGKLVPRAIIRPNFVTSFNQVWQHLRSLKRISLKTNLVAPEIPSFGSVPTICQSCGNLTQYVAELLGNLELRVGQLKGVIFEAREKGGGGGDGGGGRFEIFESRLRESTEFGRKDDEFILKFVETLDSNPVEENIKVNQRKVPLKRKHNSHTEGGRQVGTPSTSKSVIKIENEKGDVVMEFRPEPEEDTQKTGNDSDSDYNPLDDDDDFEANQDDTSASDLEEPEVNTSAKNQEEISNDDDYALATSTTTGVTFQDIFICEIKNCGKTCLGKGGYTLHKSIFHSPEQNLKFTCGTLSCGKKFRTEPLLREHMKNNLDTHPEYHVLYSKARYPCDICGEPLTLSQEQAREHLKSHFKEEVDGTEYLLNCPIKNCPYLFTNYSTAMAHLKKKHKKYKDVGSKFGLTCETCGEVCHNRLGLAGHVARSHERGAGAGVDADAGEEGKKFNCPLENCEERFYVRQSVDLHLEKHGKLERKIVVKKQKCEVCKVEIKVEEMAAHLNGVHQQIGDLLECDQCPCIYISGKGLLEHLYEHRRTKCLYCFICRGDGEKFGRHCDLRYHCCKEHGIECGLSTCDICDKKFLKLGESETVGKRARKFKSVKKKKYKCDECAGEDDIGFWAEDSLISHKIRCHGAPPFKCEECGGEDETFSSLVALNRHKKGKHLGIREVRREWRCGEEGCGRVFLRRGELREHEARFHGGERRWICESCGRAFFDRGSLRMHNDRVHLGLRPCVCEECGESFGDSQVLRTHRLIHTGERPWECEVCGQRFRHRSVLGTHLEGHREKGQRFKPNGPMKNIRKRKRKQ